MSAWVKRALLLCALLAAPPARAQSASYETAASVPTAGDAVVARKRALQEALRRAVEEAANAAAPEARGRLYLVSARARDYVPSYRVLEEGEAGGQFSLRIAAQVDVPRLLRDLQVAPTATRPRARMHYLVCTGDARDTTGLRGLLVTALRERGEVQGAGDCPVGPGDADAAAYGAALARSGAQAALVLRLQEDGSRGGAIRGTQPPLQGAVAQAHVLLLTPGKGPAVTAAEESAEASDFAETPEAASRAARRMAVQTALERITPALGGMAPTTAQGGVVASLGGIESYAQVRQLMKALAALPGVTAAEPRAFRRGDKVQTTVLLRSGATAEALAGAVARTPLVGMRLQASARGPQQLQIQVTPEAVAAPTEATPADAASRTVVPDPALPRPLPRPPESPEPEVAP